MISFDMLSTLRLDLYDITVHLFKQEHKTREQIVDVINDINSKVSSSQFYQHNVTSLFYYHPRIGFILDNVSDNDKGIYHCQFTSAYKLEELITFNISIEHQEDYYENVTTFKGNFPTTGSPTVTLLRLKSSQRFHSDSF